MAAPKGQQQIQPYSGKPGTAREEAPDAFAQIWEAKATMTDTTAMQLVELSESLRRARRPEVGKLFTSAGYLLLGAAAGAAVAGQRLDNKWVMLSGVVGLVCVAAGFFFWYERADRIAEINQRLDTHLRTMKNQEAIKRLRALCRESDDRPVARLKRWLRRRRERASDPQGPAA